MARLLAPTALAVALTGCLVQPPMKRMEVRSQDLGAAWPLTVSSGALRCQMHAEITFQWKGAVYTLEGAGPSAYPSIEAIRVPGMDLAPLVQRGRTLCQ